MRDVLPEYEEVVCAEPNSLATRRWLEAQGVSFVPSRQFLTTPADFADWARGRRRLVMEDFYREQRRASGCCWRRTGGRRAAGGTSTPRTAARRAAD